MNLKVLGSSSKGNCYVLSTPTGSLLLDCGLPWKEIQKGLRFKLGDVLGCLVTHEHKDHSKAVNEVTLAGIDCYMSMGTLRAVEPLKTHRLLPVISGKQFEIEDFAILPFQTEHDAAQPLGYLVQYRPTGEKLLFLTDSYYSKYRFKDLNYILIECNYCLDILKANIETGLIPEMLKNRLLESHFSLDNVKNFLKANDLSRVRTLILIHLSEGNSNAARMVREIQELTDKETVVAMPGMEIPLDLCPF